MKSQAKHETKAERAGKWSGEQLRQVVTHTNGRRCNNIIPVAAGLMLKCVQNGGRFLLLTPLLLLRSRRPLFIRFSQSASFAGGHQCPLAARRNVNEPPTAPCRMCGVIFPWNSFPFAWNWSVCFIFFLRKWRTSFAYQSLQFSGELLGRQLTVCYHLRPTLRRVIREIEGSAICRVGVTDRTRLILAISTWKVRRNCWGQRNWRRKWKIGRQVTNWGFQ